MFKNLIKHFLPHVGDYPSVTVETVVLDMDTFAKYNLGKAAVIQVPFDFPPNLVRKCKEWNEEYIPATPIKKDKATLVMKILPMNIRFILGCGFEWIVVVEADPVVLGGPAAS